MIEPVALTVSLPERRQQVQSDHARRRRDDLASQRLALDITARITLTTMAGAAGFIALYLLKSALGIDLMIGHSFMHDLFYGLVR